MKKYAIVCVFLSLFSSSCLYAQVQTKDIAETKSIPQYGYEYKGKFIALNPSERFVAISEKGDKFRAFVKKNRLIRDPLSERSILKQNKFGLYRLSEPSGKDKTQISILSRIKQFYAETGEVIQPVFEQGQALLIPSDELILGFDGTVSLDQARDYLKPYMEKQGILKLREHRDNTFILSISQPSNGRVYQVCRYLSKLEDIDFAEPDHIILFLFEPSLPVSDSDRISKELLFRKKSAKLNNEDKVVALPLYRTHASVSWEVLIDESFEGPSLPAGWSAGIYDNPEDNIDIVDAYWSVTDYRSYSGTRSCYATGGGIEGVAPPGDYPNNCNSVLKTPVLNLASYEEVYIELWFYAQFGSGTDLGGAVVRSQLPEESSLVGFFYVTYPGDPTAANGWRRALLRVPPRSRVDGVKVELIFLSDDSFTGEGLYIDKVRIVGTTDVDTDPISTDRYSARQYEMNNSGQIAGIGDDTNDMHLPEAWDSVSVSPHIVVAVIDSGVDKTHEDLNIFEGYEPDGSSGGAYRSNDGSFGYHGTAVAGNVGAIGDNSLGVIGSAPGVKIMPIYIGGTTAEIAAAIDVAVMKGADILSNSWGFTEAASADIENAILDALHLERVVLFAAGNGPDRPPYTYDVIFPANLTASTDVICVGASSPSDEHKAAASSDGSFLWGSSYIGPGPDVVAPSPWSYTTDITGNKGYNPDFSLFYHGSLIEPADPSSENYTPTFGGTSSSTPKVAGVAALILSANPNLTPRQVKKILRETADDIDVPGIDDKTGAGRVNAYKAVMAAFDEPSAKGLPAGTVVAFAGKADAIPNGWLLCDGQEVSRSEYRALFYAIRTAHGVGDGSTTFNLPDYRGYFLRGVDHGTGRDRDSASRTSRGQLSPNQVGSVQNDATRIPANLQVQQGGAHSHQYIYTKNHYHTGRRVDQFEDGGDGLYEQTVTGETSGVVVHTHKLIGGDKETRPKNSYVNWIIKY
jgi:subtilisin family serine protease